MLKIYGIKNCDSVKKALKFFKLHNIEHRLIDFKTEPVDINKIKEWSEQCEIKTLFNSRSTTYKTFNLKELNLDNEAKAQWMAKENLLIKRPVVEYNNKLLVGFNQTTYESEFLQ